MLEDDEERKWFKNMNGRWLERRQKLIAGLDRLLARRKQGQTFSRSEIARECGCSPEGIRQLEIKALRKLGARLKETLLQLRSQESQKAKEAWNI
jgi:DNA-directed RNA polymerase sigma subunit (sigma70/sigma32)